MQKKRVLALCLASVMVLSTMLTGCGAKEEKKETADTPTQEVATDDTEETLEPYTVTLWARGNDSKDADKVVSLVNEKLQEILPNTTLDVQFVAGSEYKDRYTKALAAGEKIDIAWSANWVNNVEDDVKNGVVLPVEDLLKQYGEGIVEAVGGWDVLDIHHSLDGELYFIPCWQGLVTGRAAIYLDADVLALMPEGWKDELQQICFDNQDYTVEAKMAIMDKLEEYLEVAKENDLLGLGVANVDRLRINNLAWYNYRINVFEESDGVYKMYTESEDPVSMALDEKYAEWFEKGYFRSDYASASIDLTEPYILYTEQALPDNWLDQQKLMRNREDLDGVLVTESNSFANGFSTGAVIPYTSENPERVMQVLNVLYTNAEIYQLLVYGEEGVHYINNADGTITRPAAGNREYEGITNWMLGTCMNSLAESKGSLETYEGLKKQEETAKFNPFLNFAFDTTNVEDIKTNLSAVAKEYSGQSMFAGKAKVAGIHDTWSQKAKSVGEDDYVAEFRAQFSAYLAENNLGTLAE